jgi:hypothetical protein
MTIPATIVTLVCVAAVASALGLLALAIMDWLAIRQARKDWEAGR